MQFGTTRSVLPQAALRADNRLAEVLRNSLPAMAGRALPGPVDCAQIPALAGRGMQRVQQFLQALDARRAPALRAADRS